MPERAHLELERSCVGNNARSLKFHPQAAAFGECSTRDLVNFGIQNGADAIIIVSAPLAAVDWRLPCDLRQEIADASTKHNISHQNGGAGSLPIVAAGRACLDFPIAGHLNPERKQGVPGYTRET